LIGLDRCYQILSWPSADRHPVRLSMKVQVVHRGALRERPSRQMTLSVASVGWSSAQT
jgi:hypothetical protein